ncbi:PREDICTED: putative lipoyltransferase 2, mitochondrial isoform X1 [Amphimedon queenslandica]|uniref:Octanoyl-[acyl-carrier-protein]:protein N-octanoyltransferase LIPT2, mitochondrial n=2 Tax=Amphimedon queenslandica TaxID=400682 RepID=A0A1X7VLQ8_AMPQE|nr:PREDICTED: putative lipoyltransferase 2, mitochondrial isoform X1 [Amphimedon queenslandica]|eukprot:XP_019864434.1 PREDICTED: putative lipoyltransferase 2, mitochondrial isoform X1 [Amphimedon queenslandica]
MLSVVVRDLGKICYRSALNIQMELVTKYSNRETSNDGMIGELLICQHDPPVYTLGLREKLSIENENKLRDLGADVVKIRRGGLITVHSVGQLVCYPVINLHKINVGVRNYVKGLEASVVRTCTEFGLNAITNEHVGVWVGGAKVCAIGIQVSRSVSFHGLALNVCNELSWYEHIVPCGLKDKEVTTMEKILNRNIVVQDVSPVLIKHLTNQFNLSLK